MRNTVQNTTALAETADGAVALVAELLMRGAAGGTVEDMEARGQRQLVESDVLPVEGSAHPALAEIAWGERVPGDPLFRYATLPEGWRKVAAPDHAMWSDVVDAAGTVRARVYYKAAHYDRRASITVGRDGG